MELSCESKGEFEDAVVFPLGDSSETPSGSKSSESVIDPGPDAGTTFLRKTGSDWFSSSSESGNMKSAASSKDEAGKSSCSWEEFLSLSSSESRITEGL